MSSSPSPPAQPTQGPPRTLTVAIASLSSVAAAIVVSHVWGPGTLIGAAATPVIVTLVSELLRRPATVIAAAPVAVRPHSGPTGTQVHPAAGQPHEPGAPRPRAGSAVPGEEPTTVVPPDAAKRSRRGPIAVAVVTGLVAFLIGAFVLTGGELVSGKSLGGGSDKTTLAGGGKRHAKKRSTTTTERTTSTPTVTETTTTTTPSTSTPAEAPSTESTPVLPPPDPGTTGATGATGATGP